MDPATVATGIGIIATALGVFGWSHATLSKRLSEIEINMHERITEREARLLIADKLAPIEVEYRSFTKRLEDIDHKLERLLDIIYQQGKQDAKKDTGR